MTGRAERREKVPNSIVKHISTNRGGSYEGNKWKKKGAKKKNGSSVRGVERAN